MDSPIPPDPYAALGVAKDADADTIKKTYRKLALKLHPDKCTDESQKASRTDQFTTIQQAYDIIGNEEKRGRYDAQVRMAELRRQNMEMRGAAAPRPDVRTAAYNTRTAAPREATYTTRGPPRPTYEPPRSTYEQPRPRYYDDDYAPFRGSTRKANVADEYVYIKRSSPREKDRERVRVTVDPRDEERRRDSKRREAEVRDARSSKYADYEEDRRRRDRDYENMRRKADAYDSYGSSTERITEERLRDAQRHMDKQTRPTMYRRESSRQGPVYRETAEVRRSAAAPKEKERARESRRTSPSKDERRRAAEDADPYDRRVPNLSTHTSSPPAMESVPPPNHRSYTTPIDIDFKKKKTAKDVSPPPPFRRSTTQPIETMAGASSSSNRKDQSSRVRHSEDSSYSTPYPYGDDRAAPPFSYTNGHRTVLREPNPPSRRKSSSPVRGEASRPSKGAMKMKDLDPKSVKRMPYSSPQSITVEPAPKSSSRRDRLSERDRDYAYTERSRQRYFGENGAGTIDPYYDQPSPYKADIRHAVPRRDRDFERPQYTRSSTFVC
jgi:curved DNA-binding protein CbpA